MVDAALQFTNGRAMHGAGRMDLAVQRRTVHEQEDNLPPSPTHDVSAQTAKWEGGRNSICRVLLKGTHVGFGGGRGAADRRCRTAGGQYEASEPHGSMIGSGRQLTGDLRPARSGGVQIGRAHV